MTRENAEAVRELWRIWSREGIEGVVDAAPEDIVAYAFPGWVGKSRQVGPDGLRAMLAEWEEAFTEYDMELSETREAGDRVVALIVQRGVTKEAGVPISARIGAVYSDFRETGEVGEVRFHPSWDQALEAGGLTPGYAEVIRAAYAAWSRRDLDTVLEALDPRVEFLSSRLFPDLAPIYRGHEGMRLLWEAMFAPFEALRIDVERVVEGDECAAVAIRFEGNGKGSGAHTELSHGHALRFKDGRVVKISAHTSFEEALNAVGLRE